MRAAFADTLIAAKERRPDLFVLDGDCAKSTNTARFAERYPDSFLNVGISEQHMIGTSAGLALMGFRPVACSFAAMLVARAGEQILQSIAYQSLPVKLAGHYAGVSGAREGAPHHAICDLAFMRAVPGMTVWTPADDGDVQMLTNALIDGDGPGYIRLSREPVPPLGNAEGDPRDGVRYWHGGEEAMLVGIGTGVGVALEAAGQLNAQGIATRVLAVTRLKPFPTEALLARAGNCRLVATVEEHSIIGGLASAVSEVLAAVGGPPLEAIGIRDTFTETGSYADLLHRYGLDAGSVVDAVKRRLEQRPHRAWRIA